MKKILKLAFIVSVALFSKQVLSQTKSLNVGCDEIVSKISNARSAFERKSGPEHLIKYAESMLGPRGMRPGFYNEQNTYNWFNSNLPKISEDEILKVEIDDIDLEQLAYLRLDLIKWKNEIKIRDDENISILYNRAGKKHLNLFIQTMSEEIPRRPNGKTEKNAYQWFLKKNLPSIDEMDIEQMGIHLESELDEEKMQFVEFFIVELKKWKIDISNKKSKDVPTLLNRFGKKHLGVIAKTMSEDIPRRPSHETEKNSYQWFRKHLLDILEKDIRSIKSYLIEELNDETLAENLISELIDWRKEILRFQGKWREY